MGIDLWGHRTPDGRSLRQVLDFMASVASGERQWSYKDVAGFKPAAIHWPLRRAAVAWNAPKYRALAPGIGGGRARMDLTTR